MPASDVTSPPARYRVRRARTGLKHQTHFISADGSERALSGGQVASADEAANEAALAILGPLPLDCLVLSDRAAHRRACEVVRGAGGYFNDEGPLPW